MPRVQQISPIAAFLNAIVAVLTLIVALVLIGPAVMADRTLLVDLALHNPTPLIIQDGLKFVAAAIALVLIRALHIRLSSGAPALINVATVSGLLSVSCLLANAVLSLVATSQAANFARGQPELGNQMNGLIGTLAFAAILANGLWYLLMSWSALKSDRLPRRLSYLGLAMGGLSLLPPLAILVLLLSIVWSAWLGAILLRSNVQAG